MINPKNNYAFGVLGPYGVGKTHALAELAPALEESGNKTRLVINDITNSGIDRITLGKLRETAEMLTGGCVGCGDVGSFTDAIGEAYAEGYSVVVEAPATLHAAEIRQALESVYGYDVAFLTMWNAVAHARNKNYGPAASTLSVANVVGLTNAEAVRNSGIESIYSYLGEHSLQGSVTVELPRSGYGEVVIETLKGSTGVRTENLHHHDHDHTCDHGECDHDHHHEPLPELVGIQASWLSSIDTTHGIRIQYNPNHDALQFTKALKEEPSIVRAKGVLYDGARQVSVQFTPEDINIETLNHTEAQGIVIYGTNKDKLAEFADRFAVRRLELEPADDIKSSLRQMTFSDEVEGLILEKLDLLSRQSIEVEGQLLTDYSEADMGYHIAKQVVGVPHELKVAAFEAYVKKRLEAAELLGGYLNDPKHPWYCLRLGTVLAFHDQEAEAHLVPDELVTSIRQARAFDMLAYGMFDSSDADFTFDVKRRVAEENPDLLVSMLEYGIDKGLVDPTIAKESFKTMKAKYLNSPKCPEALKDWWVQAEL